MQKLPPSPQTLRRLQEIKWLFERGERESKVANPRNGIVAISLAFTSAEQLISLIANQMGLAKNPKDISANWIDKAKKIDEKVGAPEPFAGSVNDLLHVAGLRNGSLHAGSKFHAIEVTQSCQVVRSLLSTVCERIYGLDLWQISVGNLILNKWVRERLQDAEAEFQKGDIEKTVLLSSAAISMCTTTAALEIAGQGNELGSVFETEKRLTHDGKFSHGPSDVAARAHLGEVAQVVNAMARSQRKALLIQLCGIEPVQRYYSLGILSTGPAWIEKGPPVENDPLPLFFSSTLPASVTLDDAEFLLRFGTDLALELEALGVDLEARDSANRWWSNLQDARTLRVSLPLPESWEAKRNK